MSVTFRNQRYRPDRFYRNRSLLDEEGPEKEGVLDQFGLVEALVPRLKGVVLSTFTLNLRHMGRVLPSLFGAAACVPTLVLHGNSQKVWRNGARTYQWRVGFHKDPKGVVRSAEAPETLRLAEVTARHDFALAKGVHHPKYMLLFLRDPDELLVLITTANLCRPWPLDCSWLQVFPGRRNTKGATDFGATLDDFLKHQDAAVEVAAEREVASTSKSKSAPSKKSAPTVWLRDTLGVDAALDDLYDFSEAVPSLVTSVPTEARLDDENDARTCSYGHRKIAALLGGGGNNATTTTSKVVLQPTSVGGDINDAYLRQLARSYGSDDVSIVWPSMRFVLDRVARRCAREKLPLDDDDDDVAVVALEQCGDVRSCPLHCSPEAFANMGNDVKAALVDFVHADPVAQGLVPHCKFVLGVNTQDASLDWLLLSSMCLSRGACGDETSVDRRPVFRMRNFEMGVLFHRPGRVPPLETLPFKLHAERLLQPDPDDSNRPKYAFLPFLNMDFKDPDGRGLLEVAASAFPGIFHPDNFLPRARAELLRDHSLRRPVQPSKRPRSPSSSASSQELDANGGPLSRLQTTKRPRGAASASPRPPLAQLGGASS